MIDRRGLLLGAGAATAMAAAPALAATPAQTAAYRRIAAECDDNLSRQVIDLWFPRAIDARRGGFLQNYAEDWSLIPRDDRATVYQGRLTWMAAEAAARYPAQRRLWTDRAAHGVAFLESAMWDRDNGGFYWGLGADAPHAPDRAGEKHMYGHAFGLYAAATVHHRTKNAAALKLAQDAFAFMEQYAHDDANGGYVESLSREGRKQLAPPDGLAPPPAGGPPRDALGTAFGLKSMNTHIHILEALTALYEAWPDRKVRARLEEVFLIVRDKVAVAPGHLHLYFQQDWTPAPRAISFGHDVETGFLLAEASAVLGRRDDTRTEEISRMLVDQPLRAGFDHDLGGFYDESDLAGKPTRTDKIWWVQAEGLNALLLMHDRYGATDPKYFEAFEKQWRFIQDRQLDHAFGGWRSRVRANGAYTPGMIKSDRWTECYHQGRSLLRVSDRLRKMAA